MRICFHKWSDWGKQKIKKNVNYTTTERTETYKMKGDCYYQERTCLKCKVVQIDRVYI